MPIEGITVPHKDQWLSIVKPNASDDVSGNFTSRRKLVAKQFEAHQLRLTPLV
jgi:hypothetical protein